MKELTFEEIKSAAFGIVSMEQKEDGIWFYRFRPDQMALYEEINPDFYRKTLATAGVRLSFTTNSTALEVDYKIEDYGSSRPFAYFDLWEDGALVHHFGVGARPASFQHEKIELSKGEKRVELYFPWSACAILKSVRLSDGATFASAKRRRTMLSYGDSITHGYDAIYPSQSYASALARMLDADAINRGIGAEVFRPALLLEKEDFEPDLITVAYGTNDWARKESTVESFCAACRSFYETLSLEYPKAKIYAITPIWRDKGDQKVEIGLPHSKVEELMRAQLLGLTNVEVISGYPLTPHHPDFFSDLKLHPNDMGFLHYATNLYRKIGSEL